jgi:sugar phosphate isomerase/epimerase
VEVGIFPQVFGRADLDAALDAVAAAGIRAVQFGWDSAGLGPMPEAIPVELAAAACAAAASRGIRIAACSGTCNLIDPDPDRRADAVRRLRTVIAACPALGAPVVTLCSGTRDPEDMWRPHRDNGTAEAWRDLRASLDAVLPDAEAAGVDLAVEPEVSNVVDSAARARRLLAEAGSRRLRVCLDGANLFPAGTLPRMAEILDEAAALLGPDVVLAHAKDLDHDGAAGHLPAGHGRLDYDRYLAGLRRAGYRGAVVLHGLAEADVPDCAGFLRARLAAAQV